MLLLLACFSPVQTASTLAIVSASPSHGEVGVSVDSDLVTVFSMNLDPETAGGVSLVDEAGTAVAALVRADGSVLRVTPAAELSSETAYTLTLEPSVAAADGSLLGSRVRSTFTTGNSWVEGDTDTDSDADTDTDTDTDVPDVEPPWMALSSAVTVDDGLWGYGVGGAWTDPYMSVTFYEDAWFDTGDEQYRCDWWGRLSDDGKTVFPESTEVWKAWRVELDSFDTDCSGFDVGVWNGETPSGHMNGFKLGIGWGPLSQQRATELEDAFTDAGQDWSQVGPTLHSVWYAFDDGSGQWDVYEGGYGIAFEVDADYELVYEDGEAIALDSDRGDPGPAVYSGYRWSTLETGLLFR
jgi:hypothetical protein